MSSVIAVTKLPGMCTLHAYSAREAVTKMCTLPLLAGENIGPPEVSWSPTEAVMAAPAHEDGACL